ncbi:MAG: phosphate ABC transporter substrate-binding protein [Lachnospiraceae bacterium]|nr:phosphate ABC transporter substrate-binding protein [Lachnospiraceae bacterium]
MKQNKYARILAIIGLIAIVAAIIYFLYASFTGKNFFFGLGVIIVIPVFIWAILFFSGAYNRDDEDDSDDGSNS